MHGPCYTWTQVHTHMLLHAVPVTLKPFHIQSVHTNGLHTQAFIRRLFHIRTAYSHTHIDIIPVPSSLHGIHQNSSVPWCYKYHAWSKIVQYHHLCSNSCYLHLSWYSTWNSPNQLGTWCYKWHAWSHFFMVFPMRFTKTPQYHDATNDTCYLIFSWHFHWNSPKQLSTMMLQTTRLI